jgi:glycosyltransferase involved in cell wall biosynthesis
VEQSGMKIALVNNYYYLRGGSERVLFGDKQALEAAGHIVSPFAPRDERNDPAESERLFPIVEDYSNAGRIGLLKAARDVVYSNSVRQAFAVFLEEFQPDIIHCHNIYGRLTTAVLDEAKRCRISTVLTVHDLKLACPAYLGLRQGEPCLRCQDGGYWRCVRYKCHKQSYAASLVYGVEAYFNRFAGKYDTVAGFLCPSHFVQSALIESGIEKDRCIYHPNAVRPEDYDPQETPGEYALYVGRLSAEKGILTMLHAIERAQIPLRIAGTGPLEAEMADLIRERDLPVTMEGYCAGERLKGLYQGAAFTIVPSEWYENASMSILESMAYGKPVLASDIGGNPELVADGKVGRLFHYGSIDDLAKRMNEMWENRQELAKMGRDARLLIEQRFSEQRRLQALLGIYSHVR